MFSRAAPMANATFPFPSEDIHELAFRNTLKALARPQCIFANNKVDRAAEYLREFVLNASYVEGAEQRLASLRPFVQIDHQIHIAFSLGSVTRH